MPEINYAEWFRREQARRDAAAKGLNQTAMPVQTETQLQPQVAPQPQIQAQTQTQTQMQMPTAAPRAPGAKPGGYGYQAPRFGQIESEMGAHTLGTAEGAAKGFATGGKIGAIIGATTAAAPGFSRAARRGWDAAKAGDVEGVSRSLAPVSPIAYLDAKLQQAGMPSWMSPFWGGTKVFSEIFGGPATNIEKKRWERLEKYYGFTGLKPEWVDTKDGAKKAEDKTLAKDFVGYNDQGKWVNNKFASTGKDADLRAQDIQEYATNFETFGKAYSALPQEKRLQVMQIALDNSLVKEQKGTVDIAWTPETYQQAADILLNDPSVQKFQAEQPRGFQSRAYVPYWKRK